MASTRAIVTLLRDYKSILDTLSKERDALNRLLDVKIIKPEI